MLFVPSPSRAARIPTGLGFWAESPNHLGSCQNYGPFWGTQNYRCRIIIRTQKGTLILTTTHLGKQLGCWVSWKPGSKARALPDRVWVLPGRCFPVCWHRELKSLCKPVRRSYLGLSSRQEQYRRSLLVSAQPCSCSHPGEGPTAAAAAWICSPAIGACSAT